MKTANKSFRAGTLFKALVLAAVAVGLVFAGCSLADDTDADKDDSTEQDNGDSTEHLLGGTFGGKSFYADVQAASAGARGGTRGGTQNLEGKLQDGTVVYAISGIYDSDTGAFALSAGSSDKVYEIAGTKKEGTALDGTGTSRDKNGAEWSDSTAPLSPDNTANPKGAPAEQGDGLSPSWVGTWTYAALPRTQILITPYSYSMYLDPALFDDNLDAKAAAEIERLTEDDIPTKYNTLADYKDAIKRRMRAEFEFVWTLGKHNILEMTKEGDDYIALTYHVTPIYSTTFDGSDLTDSTIQIDENGKFVVEKWYQNIKFAKVGEQYQMQPATRSESRGSVRSAEVDAAYRESGEPPEKGPPPEDPKESEVNAAYKDINEARAATSFTTNPDRVIVLTKPL